MKLWKRSGSKKLVSALLMATLIVGSSVTAFAASSQVADQQNEVYKETRVMESELSDMETDAEIQMLPADEVDEEKCIACGRCTRECPQHIIHLHDCANTIAVKCSNKDKGKDARGVCAVSCIGCGICEKTCTASAIHVEDNCAVIDEASCLSCGMCAVKCPRHAIYDLRGIFTKVR